MTFKPLNENDIVNTRTLLHEAIPLTGSIISGSYVNTSGEPTNVKTYPHGMFETVYDYNYLSSSANHIFDMTFGVSSNAVDSVTEMPSKKRNIYGQMAQILMGYDATGSVQRFDEDGNLFDSATDKMDQVFVLPFSRLLVKDEIKKETFSMTLDANAYDANAQPAGGSEMVITDLGASNEYRVNSPAGEYGILYALPQDGLTMNAGATDHIVDFDGVDYWRCGLIYYQAGIVVLTGSVFADGGDHGLLSSAITLDGSSDIDTMITDSTIDDINAGLRHRIKNIQFNNTTELNSTVYFCRVNHNEFNYSSNPTYLENSRVRVKTQATDDPVSYITTVGLYNDRNELLATAKLSEALKKSPSQEFTIRARLDY
jgi:hypothetical protein